VGNSPLLTRMAPAGSGRAEKDKASHHYDSNEESVRRGMVIGGSRGHGTAPLEHKPASEAHRSLAPN
jgi:hypothetical protein